MVIILDTQGNICNIEEGIVHQIPTTWLQERRVNNTRHLWQPGSFGKGLGKDLIISLVNGGNADK